jgi:L-amino acid N-acyltransferase YncA
VAYSLRAATEADAAAICHIYNQGIEDRLATLETELRTPEERRQWLASRGPRHPVIVAELADRPGVADPATASIRPPTRRSGAADPATSPISPPTRRSGAADPATSPISPPTCRSGAADPATSPISPPTSLPEQAGPATTVAWGSLNVFNARACYRYVADISVYVERGWRGKGAGRAVLARLIELGGEHGFHKLVLSAFPFNRAGVALYERLGFRTVGIYKEQGLLDGRWVDTIIMERLL